MWDSRIEMPQMQIQSTMMRRSRIVIFDTGNLKNAISSSKSLLQTATDNVLALASFFDAFPEYRNRDFYVTGESYGGIYVPTLTDLLIKTIQVYTWHRQL